MKRIFLILIVLCFSSSGFAALSEMQQANELYSRKQFIQAKDIYQRIEMSGLESAPLYLNLGNAYFKLNEIPSAILYYERALKLDPSNDDIRYNLQFANSKKIDKIDELPLVFYKRWWVNLYTLTNMDSWAILAVIMMFLFLAMMVMYILSKRIGQKKIGFWLGVTSLFFALLFTLFAQIQYMDHAIPTGIVFDPTLTVKSTPDESSADLFVIHEGTIVKIIDQIGTWYRIKLQDGSDGWIQKGSCKKI